MSKKKKLQKTESKSQSVIIINTVIILLGLILYGKSVNFGFTLDDDLYYVKNQTVLQGIKGIPQTFKENTLFGFFRSPDQDAIYRPITLSSFALQKEFIGVNAPFSHFFNVAIYILTGLILFSLLKKLLNTLNPWIPGAIALIYLAHPIHTEVVCNIKSRDELLATFFGFLALRVIAKADIMRLKDYILASVFLLLAFFSKESALTYVGIAALLFYFFKERTIKDSLICITPFLIPALIMLTARHFALASGNHDLAMSNVMYNGLNSAKNASELYATRFHLLFLFLYKCFNPFPLSWDYSFNQIPMMNFSSISVIASIIIHIGLVIAAFYFLPKRSLISFGLLFYFGSSIITNNFFLTVGASFAERFLFIPVIGIWIAVAGVIIEFLKKEKTDVAQLSVVIYAFLIIISIYSFGTFARVPDWKDNLTLFTSDVQKAPNSARANSSVANEYRDRGSLTSDLEERKKNYTIAEKYYKKSIEIYPSFAESYHNLAILSFNLMDTLQAKKFLHLALSVDAKHKAALNFIGNIFYLEKNADSALVYNNRMQEFYPDEPAVLSNLGFLYMVKGDFQKAKTYAEKARVLDPGNQRNLDNLNIINRKLGL